MSVFGEPNVEPQACVCGHKPMFCHRENARRWCGGDPASYWEGYHRGLATARRAVAEGRPIPADEDIE